MKRLPFVVAITILTAWLMPACTAAAPDCAQENVVCVGLVTQVGKVDDRGVNQSAWDALQQAKTNGYVQWVRYIESVDPRDYAKNIQTFADAGYDIIVTVGHDQGAPSLAEAAAYPKILFIGVDQPIEDFVAAGDTTPANFVGVTFPEDQAGFLAGALAAMMSQTHKIGAVCGTDETAPIWRYCEGYRAGAAYIEGQTGAATEVSVVYHSEVPPDQSVSDPTWGADTADSLIDQGADVIFGAGGQTGDSALGAAAARGVYAIGSNTDEYFLSPATASRMLSSAVELVQPAVYNLIQAAVSGDFPGGGNYAGTAGYAPFHDLDGQVPTDVKTEMDQIFNGLLTGSITTGVASEKPVQ